MELSRIGLEKRDGRERVIVELTRPAEVRVLPGAEGPARLEIKAIFDELTRRMPDIAAVDSPARLRSNFIHGIKHLPVKWSTAA